MKLIIAGSRTVCDMAHVTECLDRFVAEHGLPEFVISGGAGGADALGLIWATAAGIRQHTLPADWKKYGKAAGPIRNEEMAEMATHLVVFWDGKSRGTADMLTRATRHGLDVTRFDARASGG